MTRKTLTIGIAKYETIRARTLAIARGELKPGPKEPKVWFSSLESFAKTLSDKNRELLVLIDQREPASLSELAELTGREVPNLSRTLKSLERYGIVELAKGTGRSLRPKVLYSDFHIELSLSEPQLSGASGRVNRQPALAHA